MMGLSLFRHALWALALTHPARCKQPGGAYDGDVVLRRDVPDFVARILPLGASIVWGYNSTDGNGFRKPLRDELTNAGWNVNMVGTKRHGTMTDNDVEAHSGDTIDKVHKAALNSVQYQPNIIVINAGNNDCYQHIDIKNAGGRMNHMLDELFEKIPGVTIVLSTLVLSTNKDVEKDRGSLNDQYRALVKSRRIAKDKIVLAEMTGDGNGFVEVSDLLSDGIHPNDGGYRKMGHIFYETIIQANKEGLITQANQSDNVPEETPIPKSTSIASSSTTTTSSSTSQLMPSTDSATLSASTSTIASASRITSASTTTTKSTPISGQTTGSSASGTNLGAILHTKASSTTTGATTVPTNTTASAPQSSTTPTSSASLQYSAAAARFAGAGLISWTLVACLAVGLRLLL